MSKNLAESMRGLLDTHKQVSEGKVNARMQDIRQAHDDGKSKEEIKTKYDVDDKFVDHALENTRAIAERLSESEVKDWYKTQLNTLFVGENEMFDEPEDKGECDKRENQESFDCIDEDDETLDIEVDDDEDELIENDRIGEVTESSLDLLAPVIQGAADVISAAAEDEDEIEEDGAIEGDIKPGLASVFASAAKLADAAAAELLANMEPEQELGVDDDIPELPMDMDGEMEEGQFAPLDKFDDTDNYDDEEMGRQSQGQDHVRIALTLAKSLGATDEDIKAIFTDMNTDPAQYGIEEEGEDDEIGTALDDMFKSNDEERDENYEGPDDNDPKQVRRRDKEHDRPY